MAAPNPWLSIPAADYEGHMAAVDQREPLRAALDRVYAAVRPGRLAVLGCGPGDGLEIVDPAITERFTGVDLNPEYLALARQRHPHLTDWRCAPVEGCELPAASFDLIHAALLFEYVDAAKVVPRIAGWLAPGGVLSVVLQLPGGEAAISPTRFASLLALSGLMRLVPPEELVRVAGGAGLTQESSEQVPLARGKSFWTATFRAGGPATRLWRR